MKAALFGQVNQPLVIADVEVKALSQFEVRIQVEACALCRTDLHVIDGDLHNPKLPLILGHEIVGKVIEKGAQVTEYGIGDRIGIPWVGSTCLTCDYCRSGQENLCDHALFTGYTIDGGFAELATADSRFCFPISSGMDAAHAAPLLCAGLIGWRSVRMAGDVEYLGIYGFGAAAAVVTPVAISQGRKIFAFTSPNDEARQKFARSMGAVWAGGSDQLPPQPLDAAIIFAPVGALVPGALRAVKKGGSVICGGIHMSDIPSFPYSLLWGERTLKSVANLTRKDGVEFLELASAINLNPEITTYSLDEVNKAVKDLRRGSVYGAAVIRP